MANIIFKGEIVAIFDAEIVGTGFEKRIFWLREYDKEFPQTYNLECQQGDCNKLDNFHKGDKVECNVSIRGRMAKAKDGSKWYCINTLKVWNIVLEGLAPKTQTPPPAAPPKVAPGPQPQNNFIEGDGPDDLPF